jgi:hypothetical protein
MYDLCLGTDTIRKFDSDEIVDCPSGKDANQSNSDPNQPFFYSCLLPLGFVTDK